MNGKKTTNKHQPKKYLGQNFLVDKNILRKIIEVAQVKKTDNVLEVGPGRGVLTQELATRAKRVLAVEKDSDLISGLATAGWSNVRVLEYDVLKVSDEQLKDFFQGEPYRIIANLPYNISSQFLKLYLEREYAPTSMLLMLQKEVAERICNKDQNNSVLSLSVHFYCEPKLLFTVKKNSFKPAPKVESAIIEFKNIRKNKFSVTAQIFFELVKAGFSQKRKKLRNNLREYSPQKIQEFLIERGYSESVRAEELSLFDWVKLAQGIEK